MSREAMQPALNALEPIVNNSALDPRDRAYAAQQILRAALADRAQRDPSPPWGDFENWHALYEELRAAIDGGSESMTHADALAQVKACKCCDVSAAQPAPEAVAWLHQHGATGLTMFSEKEKPDSSRWHSVGPVFLHAPPAQPAPSVPDDAHAQGYAAGRASLMPLLEQARQTLGGVANLGPNDQFQIQAEENAIIAIKAALKEIKP